MERVADLVAELKANRGSLILVAIAAYPRVGWTGQLPEIGDLIARSLDLLQSGGAHPFRILHGVGVVLLQPREGAAEWVSKVRTSLFSSEVELRWLVAEVEGGRSAEWIDDLLGDLSVRVNFGRFSQDRVVRFVDHRQVADS